MTADQLRTDPDSDRSLQSSGGREHDEAKLVANRPSVRRGAGAYEPHRNWHVFSLGADLVNYDLSGHDAEATIGLWGLSAEELIQFLADANREGGGSECAGELLKRIIDRRRHELATKGAKLAWNRRWQRYHEDLTRWNAQPDSLKNGHWRQRQMTVGQRALVQVTAVQLGIIMPEGLKRGTAADWLDQHGANLSYRQEA